MGFLVFVSRLCLVFLLCSNGYSAAKSRRRSRQNDDSQPWIKVPFGQSDEIERTADDSNSKVKDDERSDSSLPSGTIVVENDNDENPQQRILLPLINENFAEPNIFPRYSGYDQFGRLGQYGQVRPIGQVSPYGQYAPLGLDNLDLSAYANRYIEGLGLRSDSDYFDEFISPYENMAEDYLENFSLEDTLDGGISMRAAPLPDVVNDDDNIVKRRMGGKAAKARKRRGRHGGKNARRKIFIDTRSDGAFRSGDDTSVENEDLNERSIDDDSSGDPVHLLII